MMITVAALVLITLAMVTYDLAKGRLPAMRRRRRARARSVAVPQVAVIEHDNMVMSKWQLLLLNYPQIRDLKWVPVPVIASAVIASILVSI